MEGVAPPIAVDERAAGVCLGADPYRDLELYLQKVNDEIGEVFDRWGTTDVGYKFQSYQNGHHTPITNPTNHYAKIHNNTNHNREDNIVKPKEYNKKNYSYKAEPKDCNSYDNELTDRFLEEFNDIIAKELIELAEKYQSPLGLSKIPVDSDSEPDYDEVFTSDDDDDVIEPATMRISRSKSLDEQTSNNDNYFSCRLAKGHNIGTLPRSELKDKNAFLSKHTPLRSSFARILRKNKEKVLEKPGSNDAVLVSVSSLPDADIVESSCLGEERRNTEPEMKKNLRKIFLNGEQLLTRRKLLSPLVIDSGFSGFTTDAKHETVLINHDYKADTKNDERFGVDADLSSTRKSSDSSSDNYIDLVEDLSSTEFEKALESGGIERCEFLSHTWNEDCLSEICQRRRRLGGVSDFMSRFNEVCDASTQTHNSPSLSRSSSFTWMSECSSSVFQNGSDHEPFTSDHSSIEDGRSSCSMDVTHGSDVNSRADAAEGGIESGIGTASPPLDRHGGTKEKRGAKCKRKETWEKLRRRQTLARRSAQLMVNAEGQEIWVRRESVTTQTDGEGQEDSFNSEDKSAYEETSSNENLLLDGPIDDVTKSEEETPSSDLPRAKSSRPIDLPLGVSKFPYFSGDFAGCARASSAGSEREQPSPSTASLKLSSAPLVNDLGNKSSSAPILLRKPVKRADQERRRDDIGISGDKICQKPRSQSEKQISGE